MWDIENEDTCEIRGEGEGEKVEVRPLKRPCVFSIPLAPPREEVCKRCRFRGQCDAERDAK